MTTLNAVASNDKGFGSVHEGREPTALDLLAALNSVDVIGAQMFERDCLGFTFDSWRQAQAESNFAGDHCTAADVLSDIADIRALPQRYSEISEVDLELLDAAAAIESYVRSCMPSVQ